MDIAIIANLYKELSNNAPGGTELFAFLLTQELSCRNSIKHIDVYGVGNNPFVNPKISFIKLLETDINTFMMSNQILKELSSERPYLSDELQYNLITKTYKMISEKKYDIIHNNSTSSLFHSLNYLQVAKTINTPVITTLHTNISSPSVMIPYQLKFHKLRSNYYFTPIAHHQIRFAKEHSLDIPLTSPVYNGIDIKQYSFQENTPQKNNGLWVGRISKKHNKGLKETLIATKRLETSLIVIATIDDQKFFDDEIQPLIHNHVKLYIPSIKSESKAKIYKNSSFFIYPIMWEEPFGFIFLEAMASGTPIIAYAKGAVPEIVKDGETGFIINSSNSDIRGNWVIKKTGIDGLCEAINHIKTMPENHYLAMRKACRKQVENKFTIKQMVDKYEKIYAKIINHHKII
jgi:glycosyltransferase involved in cell wall biosynthesis